jgi:2-oxoglutarate dehydrogenase E1 component
VKQEAEKYPNASIVWAQEEPKNMGAWTYVHPRIITALGEKNFRSIR